MLLAVVLLLLSNSASAGQVYDCPTDWRTYETHCYYFVYFPKQEFSDAMILCQNLGASLLTINSQGEHDFIKKYLEKHDQNRGKWYTSGQRDSPDSETFHWDDETGLAFADAHYWLVGNSKDKTGSRIIYNYKDGKYGWSLSAKNKPHHYICEIRKSESFKIIQQHRTFEYGNEGENPNLIKMGPKFFIQPKDVVYVSREKSVHRLSHAKVSRKEKEFTFFECAASGNPQVKYKWFKDNKELSSASNLRYTLSNGRFIISHPHESDDSGYYQCVAENKFGAILSNPVQLSFGSIGEFSNVQTQYVRADAYEGAMITCSQITYKPAVTYEWVKGNIIFIRTEKQPYMFISSNGRLYFSEVTRDDEGLYSCLVTLTSISGAKLAMTQPSSRVSMPIQLIVQDKPPKINWGPIIHNDFIVVFPQPPLRGQTIQLECFAYGSSPINYIWHREGKPLPPEAKMSNNNRILTIQNADIADQGIYICIAYRGRSGRTQKKISLVLSVKPFFQYPLKDQHLNIGSRLTWHCDAKAFPKATYSWYKNGVLFHSNSNEIKVNENILIIERLDPSRDSGMYQCAATNKYGSTYSSAQLRVLAFKPSFHKNPIGPSIWAAVNGNITILCQPEASPTPEVTWDKNGIEMDLQLKSKNSRIQLFQNGNLFIEKLTHRDSGNYTCRATNSHGTASSSAYLFVQEAITLTRRPKNTTAVINETAFLYCEVSHNKDIDLVYYWKFNGRTINTNLDSHYEMAEENAKSGGLVIRTIQFKHQGCYTCVAETPLDNVEAKAHVKVIGPPGAASGVNIEPESVTPFSMRLRWSTGVSRGQPIVFQVIEASTNFEPEWQIVANHIPDGPTHVDNEDKRMVQVNGLNPGTSYRFRVRAVNAFGLGDPSWPSVAYRTPTAAPQKPPSHVAGGGGSVGVLTINWKPLAPKEQAGRKIGYIVYWRKKSSKTRFEKRVLNYDTDHFVALVGEHNYYLEYEVKVQAFNDKGKGPISSIKTIMSAENLPVGVPTNVMCEGYNGSALEVTWTKVPNTRELMKGQVIGYQINYWMDGEEDPLIRFIRYPGQVESGLIIGLSSDTAYWTNVQVYNSAGLGPPSENFINEVPYAAPINYPTEVFVHSHGPKSVRVTWRGTVTTRVGEMTLTGYRIRVCGITETIYCNNYYDFGQVSEGIVDNLEKNKLYKLRVLGYSEGGDGKMSEVVYFTLGGTVQFNPKTAQILAHGVCLTVSSALLFLTTLLNLL